MRHLQLHKAGGHTHLRTEHFNKWLREEYSSEGTSTPPSTERWHNLVEITQLICKHREIPRELGWTILVLIPKGNTDIQGIGLLGFMWKVVEAIIDNNLRSSVRLHDVLHGLCAGRGMGTEILELNLAHDLASMD